MIEQLVENVPNMTNPELIGLAKNRFMPEPVQMAIARHYYRRAHMYLCENTGLANSVRDYLYSDECNRGYVNKATLVANGHYNNQPEQIEKLYNTHGNRIFSQSPWRANQCFIRGGYWNNTTLNTSSKLLNKIYDERFARHKSEVARRGATSYYAHNLSWGMKDMAKHPNCDLSLAIKLSTCGDSNVEKLAFQKIVELSK